MFCTISRVSGSIEDWSGGDHQSAVSQPGQVLKDRVEILRGAHIQDMEL